MTITTQEIQALGRLVQLAINDEQATTLADQFRAMTQDLDPLLKLESPTIKPMYTPWEEAGALREDVAQQTCTRDQILNNAPHNDGQYFIVPRIV